ncbi:MAG: MCE family protein [Proteobacteria bacterium]|nr:MCE family protein [Pseudomonadota bacterium]
MERKTPAAQVGLFVLIGLVLIAALLIHFSKGASFWRSGRTILISAGNVGGLAVGAPVNMSGVRIGSVQDISLSADGRRVAIRCRIEKPVTIHGDARFEIEQSGFLGDQFVAIIPTRNAAPPLQDGAEVIAVDPFNLQEAARSAVGLMTRLDQVVERVDRMILSASTLKDVTNTLANLRRTSERLDRTLVEVESLVSSEKPAVAATVSNLQAFSATLTPLAGQVGALASRADSLLVRADTLVATNEAALREAVGGFRDASLAVRDIAQDLQAGRGAVGSLLKDPKLQAELGATVGHFATVSSNLARNGLFWKPKRVEPLTNTTGYPGRGPFR